VAQPSGQGPLEEAGGEDDHKGRLEEESWLWPHYGDAHGVGDGDYRIGVSVVDKRRYHIHSVNPPTSVKKGGKFILKYS
jgi:hypothetical protein